MENQGIIITLLISILATFSFATFGGVSLVQDLTGIDFNSSSITVTTTTTVTLTTTITSTTSLTFNSSLIPDIGQNQAAPSAIAIEVVTFNINTAHATIIFRNVGSISIFPVSLTAQGLASNEGFSSSSTNTTALTPSDAALEKGESGTYSISLPGIWYGDVITFKITTTAGTFAQATFTAS